MNPFTTAIARLGLTRETTGQGGILFLLLSAYGANYTGTFPTSDGSIRECQRVLKAAGLLDTMTARETQFDAVLQGLATRHDG